MADRGFNKVSYRTSYQVALKWKKKIDREYARTIGNSILNKENIMALSIPNCLVGNYDKENYGFYICPDKESAYNLVNHVSRRNLAELVHIDAIEKP